MPTPINFTAGLIGEALAGAERLGEWTAGPTPSDPVGGAAQSAMRRVCRSWANAPTWAQATPASGLFGMRRACLPYLDGNGWDTPDPGSSEFSGGQCPVLYDVTGDIVLDNGEDPPQSFPINNFGIGPFSFEAGSSGPTTNFKLIRDASGKIVASAGGDIELSGITLNPVFTRRDGQADDCGNPPGASPGDSLPPDPGLDGPETPRPAPDGGLYIPIPCFPNPAAPEQEICLPDLYIPPPGGSSPGSPEAPEPAGDEEEPEGSGSGGGISCAPDPDENKKIVGVALTLVEPPDRLGKILPQPSYPIFPRVVGNMRAIYESPSPDGDSDIQIRGGRACAWVPLKGMAIRCVAVNLLPGLRYKIQFFQQEE